MSKKIRDATGWAVAYRLSDGPLKIDKYSVRGSRRAVIDWWEVSQEEWDRDEAAGRVVCVPVRITAIEEGEDGN